MTASSPTLLPFMLDAPPPVPIGRIVTVSLVLHLIVVMSMIGIRWSPKVVRPDTSYQVTLVSLPPAPKHVEAPPPAPVEPPPPIADSVSPPPTPEPGIRMVAAPKAKPSAPVKGAVSTIPAPSDDLARKRAQELQKVLQGIERPPEAPKLGDFRPPQIKPQEPPPSSSLSEEVNRHLEELKPSRPKPMVAAKPMPKKPVTAIRVSGADTSMGRYLSLIQSKISAQWVAPPVDMTAKSYQVVIKFQLHRTGTVTDVVIERSSGNGYYDDAGKRAIQAADPLPPFPADISEKSLDTHFSFTVGEEVG